MSRERSLIVYVTRTRDLVVLSELHQPTNEDDISSIIFDNGMSSD